MANRSGVVKQVSFKKSEVFMLDKLEETYQPFAFSNYVKQLIMKDIGMTGKKHYQSESTFITTTQNDFKIDAEREELEL